MPNQYHWNFDVIWEYREVFLRGIVMTLELAAVTIVLGMVLGFLLALLRGSRIRALTLPVGAFIELVRAVPPLVLIVWMYYCLPILTGLALSAFQTAVVALALYSAAFFAEIFRAGLQSIEIGHIEAAYSVGMTRMQAMRRIIGPLAFQRVFPPLVSQCVLVVKNTSLAGYIAVAETLYQGQQISIQTFRPLEVLTVVALLFIVIIVPLTVIARVFEAAYQRKYFR
ncbi:amino acid ABC transporter permease [Acuticoccus mangrovi]|uniref:Amino acid ABC transporter permease n=1 Tax=Acuticoccus mangrovi TaxID=2796142 RepID=A0A934IPZ7_9HYPH|nr:amino acid ABC transporter permease [Acuticoccus mangrovi]MBJ3776556.1 amino acid ABC transporter permease [Acuticoccus mangrovi]